MVNTQPSQYKSAFLWALCIGALLFLPFVIYDSGYFIYYGDFNVQQIPFYKLAHEAVRSGNVFWSWHTDLGANFIGSYSFYLLFSPFFWLTLPFPTDTLPFLMAPLLVLKTACASLTACLYLERFVRDKSYAVFGGLLYAFSGWMFFNIFFNHFHDVAVFFPLLLYTAELLVCENKKGLFAIAVAANAMVNYWFFMGEVVFVLMYIIVRMCTRGWLMTPGKFMRLAFEAVLGVGIAAVVLLPSLLALTGNPRTGTSELLTGWNLWLYWHEQRQPAILISLFLPPDLPARPNFLPDHGAKWASLSAWLPLIGMTGVMGYFYDRRDDWVKRLLWLCLVFALVPGLNSLFILLNHSYYARWFYMPILIMALASIRALEESADSIGHFTRAIRWSAVIVAAFVLMSGVTPNLVNGELRFGLAPYPHLVWIYAAISFASLFLMWLMLRYLRHHPQFLRRLMALYATVCLIFGYVYMFNGKYSYERDQFVINTAIGGKQYVDLPHEPFARSDVYDDMDNLAMYWGLPNIQAFHSIVPPSIMEFYPTVGVKRDVGSRPEADYYALRPLLSVRWLFVHHEKEEQQPMPGYEPHSHMAGFNVYENANYLPMGFGYTHFISDELLHDADVSKRGNVMLAAMVLEESAIQQHWDIIAPLDVPLRGTSWNEARMEADVATRRSQAAYDFRIDNRGFTAYSNLDQTTLMFFSVPWEAGWSATVNGELADIVRANVGFMAVRVPVGEAEIRFDYHTPGLAIGGLISAAVLVTWLLYFVFALKNRPAKAEETEISHRLLMGETVHLSRDEYMHHFYDKKARAARLQRALNEAAVRHIPDELSQAERTLPFKPDNDGQE